MIDASFERIQLKIIIAFCVVLKRLTWLSHDPRTFMEEIASSTGCFGWDDVTSNPSNWTEAPKLTSGDSLGENWWERNRKNRVLLMQLI